MLSPAGRKYFPDFTDKIAVRCVCLAFCRSDSAGAAARSHPVCGYTVDAGTLLVNSPTDRPGMHSHRLAYSSDIESQDPRP